jgi:hypothetical protein
MGKTFKVLGQLLKKTTKSLNQGGKPSDEEPNPKFSGYENRPTATFCWTCGKKLGKREVFAKYY